MSRCSQSPYDGFNKKQKEINYCIICLYTDDTQTKRRAKQIVTYRLCACIQTLILGKICGFTKWTKALSALVRLQMNEVRELSMFGVATAHIVDSEHYSIHRFLSLRIRFLNNNRDSPTFSSWIENYLFVGELHFDRILSEKYANVRPVIATHCKPVHSTQPFKSILCSIVFFSSFQSSLSHCIHHSGYSYFLRFLSVIWCYCTRYSCCLRFSGLQLKWNERKTELHSTFFR